ETEGFEQKRKYDAERREDGNERCRDQQPLHPELDRRSCPELPAAPAQKQDTGGSERDQNRRDPANASVALFRLQDAGCKRGRFWVEARGDLLMRDLPSLGE